MRLLSLTLTLVLAWTAACKLADRSFFKAEDAAAPKKALKVSGSKLVDDSGAQVRLKGVSFHNLSIFPITTGMIDFVKQRGANVVRIPLYLGDKTELPIPYEKYKGMIDELANHAIKQGMYVIFDFHPISDPKKPEYLALAKRFFSDIVPVYGKSNQVFYEIFNEPKDASWADIKKYATDIIKHIRSLESDNKITNPAVIIVGTPEYSSNISAAANEPLAEPNLMYTFHFYAKTHVYKEEFEAIADKIAIFVTEWAPFDPLNINDPGINRENLTKLLEWMDRKQISWTCWSFSDEDGMYRLFRARSLQKEATEEKLEPWGRFAMKRLSPEKPVTAVPVPKDAVADKSTVTNPDEKAKESESGSKETDTQAKTPGNKIPDYTTTLAADLDQFVRELGGSSGPTGGDKPTSPSDSSQDCTKYNKDGLSCSAVGIAPGEEKCQWEQKWRCTAGCAEWISSCP